MNKCWCGSSDFIRYSNDYSVCNNCKTLVCNNMFDNNIYNVNSEENDLYGKNYWEKMMLEATSKNSLSEVIDMYLSERVLYWLKYIFKYAALGGIVTEIGCGLGQLQYVLRCLEYNQLAYELSPYICDYMTSNLGINTFCGTFRLDDIKKDIVCIFDLFEHLDNPNEFLDICYSSLKDTGVLIMQTPCFDDSLSYEQMLQKKGRFKEQLKSDQHIYLYSKYSIQKILKEKGFNYIIFEPAFFGDDYDMFIIASKNDIKQNEEKEIDKFLNSVSIGRIVKALIHLFDDNEELVQKNINIEAERNKILNDENKLVEEIKRLNKENEEYKKAADERLEKINQLSEESKEYKKAADERLEKINQLSEESKEYKKAADERLEKINQLSEESKEYKKAADERLEKINQLSEESKEYKKAADERLEKINQLSEESKEYKKAADERLEKINQLSEESEIYKKAADERLEKINQLSEESEIYKKAADERLKVIEQICVSNIVK